MFYFHDFSTDKSIITNHTLLVNTWQCYFKNFQQMEFLKKWNALNKKYNFSLSLLLHVGNKAIAFKVINHVATLNLLHLDKTWRLQWGSLPLSLCRLKSCFGTVHFHHLSVIKFCLNIFFIFVNKVSYVAVAVQQPVLTSTC